MLINKYENIDRSIIVLGGYLLNELGRKGKNINALFDLLDKKYDLTYTQYSHILTFLSLLNLLSIKGQRVELIKYDT